MDHKSPAAAAPAYSHDQVPYHQPQQSAYPHPQPPPAYDAGYQDATYLPPQHQIPVQPTIVHTVYQQVGPEPTNLTCPSCRETIVTNLDYETTTKTHISAGLLCILFWPCAWLPYVMDTCKNANHYCPNCGAFIGTYKN